MGRGGIGRRAQKVQSRRLPFVDEEAFGRLRECGVTGDNASLAALLDAAHFDVERAANLFFDGVSAARAQATSISNDVIEEAAEAEDRFFGSAVHAGNAASSMQWRGSAKSSVAASTHGNMPPASHDRRRQRGINISLRGTEGYKLPTGLQYVAHHGYTYEIDVLRMEQTEVETGIIQKVRRVKDGVWSFNKRNGRGTNYPEEVSHELERIFLAHGGPSDSWSRVAAHAPAATMTVAAPAAPIPALRLPLGVVPDVSDLASVPLTALIEWERSLSAGSLFEPVYLETLRERLFHVAEEAVAKDESNQAIREAVHAAALLSALKERHSLQCSVADARRAGLVIGSMVLLRSVIASAPELCLVGSEIFDRRYTKLRMNWEPRKNSLRCLLARGMRLGSGDYIPPSKLLRKLEADAEPHWRRRYLAAMVRACPTMPEPVTDRVQSFLSEEP